MVEVDVNEVIATKFLLSFEFKKKWSSYSVKQLFFEAVRARTSFLVVLLTRAIPKGCTELATVGTLELT